MKTYCEVVVRQLREELELPRVQRRPRGLRRWARGYLANFLLAIASALDTIECILRLIMFWRVGKIYPLTPIGRASFWLSSKAGRLQII
jgi:hypothetical protein